MDFLLLVFIYLFLIMLGITLYMAGDRPILKEGPIGSFRTRVNQIIKWPLKWVPCSVKLKCLHVYDYVFFQRNSIFQAIYALLVVSGNITLLADAMPYLYDTDPDTNHIFEPLVLFLINAILFVVCSKSDAGDITPHNLSKYEKIFSPDGTLYKCGNECSTCKHEKPARSKHCAVYNKCIFKFDHYCAWTNNCVGGLNHRYFMAFLASLCAMCADAVYLSVRALIFITAKYQLLSLRFLDSRGTPQAMNFRVLIQTLFLQFPRLVFLATSLSVITVFMLAFTGYHCYLVVSNQTTNERYKKHFLQKTRPELDLTYNPYNKGIIQNIIEELFPLQTCSWQRKKANSKKK